MQFRRLDGDRDPGQRRTVTEPGGGRLTIRGARDRVRTIFDLAGLSAHRCIVFESENGDVARRGAG
jgi:hypothetical protein